VQVRIKRPVLLVGETGTSKTATTANYLRELNREQNILLNMNFSSRTTSLDVQRNLEANVEKRTKDTYGPPMGKRLIVFIDDMNMPQVRLMNVPRALLHNVPFVPLLRLLLWPSGVAFFSIFHSISILFVLLSMLNFVCPSYVNPILQKIYISLFIYFFWYRGLKFSIKKLIKYFVLFLADIRLCRMVFCECFFLAMINMFINTVMNLFIYSH